MKFLTSLLLAFISTISIAQVQFEKTLEDAFTKAKAENKLVFIDYYNSECSICQQVEPMFDIKEIGDFYNTHFVGFKINTNSYLSRKDVDFIIQKGLRIDGVPKFIFFDYNQNFIHYSGIAPDIKSFFDVAEAAIDPAKQLSKTPELYKAGDRSLKLLYAYSSYALLFGEHELANQISDDLFEVFPKENLNNLSSYFLLKNAVFTTENGFFQHWINNLDKLKDFETGYKKGKEKEQLERIIALDLNDKNRVWTTQNLLQLRKYMELVRYSSNIDMILWEKELNAFVKENKTSEANALLKKIISKQKSEKPIILYAFKHFLRTVKNEENINFAYAEIQTILNQHQNPATQEEKDFIEKLNQLLK